MEAFQWPQRMGCCMSVVENCEHGSDKGSCVQCWVSWVTRQQDKVESKTEKPDVLSPNLSFRFSVSLDFLCKQAARHGGIKRDSETPAALNHDQ